MAVAVWEYTLCPNCGKDYGFLNPVTGWCKYCTDKTRVAKKECLLCWEPIFAQRKDAKFCTNCKKYKPTYNKMMGQKGLSHDAALAHTREMYRKDLFDDSRS